MPGVPGVVFVGVGFTVGAAVLVGDRVGTADADCDAADGEGADCDGDSGVVSGARLAAELPCVPQAANATTVSASAATTAATLDLRLSDIADELIRPR